MGLVFTSGRTGYLAAVPEPPTSGYAGGAVSELQGTTDGGQSWTTLWRGRGTVLHWVGAKAGAVVAAGVSTKGPVLVESSDGGASWRQVPVSLSLPPAAAKLAQAGGADWYWGTSTLCFLNEEVGSAFPDAMYGQAAPSPGALFRTVDGGRRWAPVPFPRGSPSGGLAEVVPQIVEVEAVVPHLSPAVW